MHRSIVCFLVAAIVAGCGGSSSSPSAPTSTTAAEVTVSVNPNPITASTCSPSQCSSGADFYFVVTLVITETAGVGGNVDFVNVTLRNPTTGQEVGTVNLGADEVIN